MTQTVRSTRVAPSLQSTQADVAYIALPHLTDNSFQSIQDAIARGAKTIVIKRADAKTSIPSVSDMVPGVRYVFVPLAS